MRLDFAIGAKTAIQQVALECATSITILVNCSQVLTRVRKMIPQYTQKLVMNTVSMGRVTAHNSVRVAFPHMLPIIKEDAS